MGRWTRELMRNIMSAPQPRFFSRADGDALRYAKRRAEQEQATMVVYNCSGTCFVRPETDEAPEGSDVVARFNSQGERLVG